MSMSMESVFSKIQLGDELTEAQCIELIGPERCEDSERYALYLLALKHQLEKHLRQRFRRIITVRATQHGLQILNDQQAAAYNPKRFADGLKIARRAHRRLLGVDPGKLTPEQREDFGRAVTQQAAKLSMIRTPTPDPELQPVEDKRPRLFARKPTTAK